MMLEIVQYVDTDSILFDMYWDTLEYCDDNHDDILVIQAFHTIKICLN